MRKRTRLFSMPQGITRISWWSSAASVSDENRSAVSDGKTRDLRGRSGLIALVFLADFLFWHHAPGLSLALFAMATLAVGGIGRSTRLLIWPLLFLVVGALPVIEHVQPLSLVFLAATFVVALSLLHCRTTDFGQTARSALGFLLSLPRGWITPLKSQPLRRVTMGFHPGLWLRDWAFPLGGSLVFIALLMDANPMLLRIAAVDLDLWTIAWRVLFWLGVAILVAPLLTSALPQTHLPGMPKTLRLPGFGINPRSVLRALVMFNMLVTVQMISDVTILVAGAALPAGMSYAEYAHRGAYPLLATAMLASAFTLAARPFWTAHPLIRPLLLLWIGQNFTLCGAAALRLDLYVEAYGLTHLRLYALIWMALVAAGLGLLAWQLVRGRNNLWFFSRAGALGVATLYLCSFVNFAETIAEQNLSRDKPDMFYICDLGPMASGAVAAALATRSVEMRFPNATPCAARVVPEVAGWREWGFRSWRITRKVARLTASERRW
jgi:Domain of unknown function (DUF4173)